MEGATAEAALAGFTCILNRVHMPMRKTLTYDQGKEMSRSWRGAACRPSLAEAQ
jgi:transposase, IS30 family